MNRSDDRHKRPPKTKCGLKGVIYQNHVPPLTKPYKAYIRKNGQYHLIGYFASKEEAGREYDKAALQIYGPETYLNFPPKP